jgi:uncharacterized protein (TIGR02145 family)
MDRNLGASRAATFAMDSYAYGDLYQWGRFADGHQCRNSEVSQTLSSRERTQDARFIVTTASPWDWRTSFNSKLWLGSNAVNNPCPLGFRLPSSAEWLAEIATWKTRNAAGAYASFLKLQLAGNRYYSHARLLDVGSIGNYWSSSVDYPSAKYVYLNSHSAQILKSYLGYGFSVRCIKDE